MISKNILQYVIIASFQQNYKYFESLSKEEEDDYMQSGIQLIANNELACILLAGGQVIDELLNIIQATRFSPETIKGDYDFGLPSRSFILLI